MKPFIGLALAALLLAPALAKDGNDPFAVCHKDMERLCKDVRPGEGRIVKCMEERKASLSSECAALMERKKEKEAQHKPPKTAKQQY